MSQHTELIASLRAESDELIKYQFSHTKEAMSCLQRLHDLSLEAADALQAMEPSELDKTADNNKVICPNCCHQFTAIPVNVQTRLQAMERQKRPDDLEQIIDAFIEDYEMIGETEDGRDACHTPTEGERSLIKDAICGLLADTDWENAWGDLIRYQAQQRTGERVPMTEEVALKIAHRRATTYTHRSDPHYSGYAFVPYTLMDFVRDLEAHHKITPPESKG